MNAARNGNGSSILDFIGVGYRRCDCKHLSHTSHVILGGCMSYEEEDACHMRRKMHVISREGCMSYEEEDAFHIRKRTHVKE